jgi:hypothetical protein
MYTSRADEASSSMVGIFAGAEQSDADYAESIRSIAMSDDIAASLQRTHVVILVTEAKTPRPPAIWRRRFAEGNNLLRAETYYFALVSPNVLIRGVFTAVVWLTRARPGYHFAAFQTFDEAAGWVRSQTSNPYPILEKLYAAVRGEPSA